MTGRVHSIETLGAVDGPGVRCVVFLQGCPLRCRYCQNPDTWDAAGGQEMQAGELLDRVARLRAYFGRRGGVTFSGGEPLAQPDFLRELLAGCRQRGIHTAIDTSGCIFNDATAGLLDLADLVILDVKHTDPGRYHELTGGWLEPTLKCLDYLARQGRPTWVRQVIVPGLNASPGDARALAGLLANVQPLQRVELLAFHQMGLHKWTQAKLRYELEGVEPPSPLRMRRLAACLAGRLSRARPPALPPVEVACP